MLTPHYRGLVKLRHAVGQELPLTLVGSEDGLLLVGCRDASAGRPGVFKQEPHEARCSLRLSHGHEQGLEARQDVGLTVTTGANVPRPYP